jgi:hypothetical protein
MCYTRLTYSTLSVHVLLFFCVLFYTYQVQVLNLISLGTTMFLCVKDSLKIKNK